MLPMLGLTHKHKPKYDNELYLAGQSPCTAFSP